MSDSMSYWSREHRACGRCGHPAYRWGETRQLSPFGVLVRSQHRHELDDSYADEDCEQ